MAHGTRLRTGHLRRFERTAVTSAGTPKADIRLHRNIWDAPGRVEMWRGGCRLNISVAASFVWRCLSSSTMTPFPHPAHRTGQADFPHPALGQDFTPSLSRATPSAVSEHFLELIGCPISMSFTTYCVCLELRSLPSTGITRLHWYYEPLRHPRAPGLSLEGRPVGHR